MSCRISTGPPAAASAPQPSSRASRTASASFLCGLLALLVLVISMAAFAPTLLMVYVGLGLAAIVLGIASLLLPASANQVITGRGRAVWGIALPLFSFVGGALLMPAT
jgi:hypothetical protein